MKLNRYICVVLLLLIISIINSCKKDPNNGNSNTQATLTPKVDFTYAVSNIQIIPDTITLTNTTQNGTSYQWTLWDGTKITTTTLTPISYPVTSYPGGPLSVTLTATNSYGSATVTKQILLSATVITSVTPALAGSVATITGVNFAAGTANNQVTLNGAAVTVLAATSTSISFMVPANATTGKLVLTSNGATIPTKFTAYGLFVELPQPGSNSHLKRVAFNYQGQTSYPYNYTINIYGVNETDSLFDLLHSKTGGGGQYVGTSFSYAPAVPINVKLMGVSTNNLTGSDFNIYSLNTGAVLAFSRTALVLAGNGVSGYADGTGTTAQFVAPFGIANDAAGNAYVTDAHRIRKITPTGLVTTLAGSGADGHTDGQGTSATFGNLWGIAVDAAGNVYVSDVEYRNIRKITSTGAVNTFAGSGAAGLTDGSGTSAQFSWPKGIAIDGNGNLFVCDSNYNNATGPYTSAIRIITPFGIVGTLMSSAKGDDLSNPDGIVFNGGGLQICNTGPTAIQNLLNVDFVAK